MKFKTKELKEVEQLKKGGVNRIGIDADNIEVLDYDDYVAVISTAAYRTGVNFYLIAKNEFEGNERYILKVYKFSYGTNYLKIIGLSCIQGVGANNFQSKKIHQKSTLIHLKAHLKAVLFSKSL